jgi:tetraacyldisaccharide-1-P 4'-kinase
LRRVTHLQDRSGRERSVPTRALLVSAIARPDAFARSLRALGVDVVGHAVFRDHHAYTGDDANSLAERCGGFPGASMIMTEKDWVKLRRFDWSGVDVCIARLDVEWVTAGLSV